MIRRFTFSFLAFLLIVFFGVVGYGQTPQLSAGRFHRHYFDRHSMFKLGTSGNWSGYAAETDLNAPQDNAVSNVSGDWTVPKVSCSRQSSYSAVWVGIDGYSDSTVEQTGTEQDCWHGRAQYYAWYEMYPKNMYQVRLAVSPGDHMSASVQYAGTTSYTLTLKNKTTGRSFSTTQQLSGTERQSAEWVVEAPSSYYGVLPLANFGKVNITNASATLNNHTGSISDSSWQHDKIVMETAGGTAKATPGDLSTDGSSFTDTWDHN